MPLNISAKKKKAPRLSIQSKKKRKQGPKEEVKIHLPVVMRVKNELVWCPYQRRTVGVVLCCVNSKNPTHNFCFGCPDGSEYEKKLGGRTYSKFLSKELMPPYPQEHVYVPVDVPLKIKNEYGLAKTYARISTSGKMDRRLPELDDWTAPAFALLGQTRPRYEPKTKEQLEQAVQAARSERSRMAQGKTASAPAVKKQKEEPLPMSRYFPDSTATAGSRKGEAKGSTPAPRPWAIPKESEEQKIAKWSETSMVKKEATKLFMLGGKRKESVVSVVGTKDLKTKPVQGKKSGPIVEKKKLKLKKGRR